MSTPDLRELRASVERARARLAEIDADRQEAERRLADLERELAAHDHAASTDADGETSHSAPTQPRSTGEKIALFRSLFRGRTDVYPTRWQNEIKGTAGYAPACANEWIRGVCKKPRIRCGDCPNQAFLPVTDQVVIDHLKGRLVAGLYPLLEDETCRLLAADFDGDAWEDDVAALVATCERHGIHPAIERSRSGNGAHVWFFFDAPIEAYAARKMGCFLITETMSRRPALSMSSYDRLFPNQDTMPRGGFGNLISLPFQDEPRRQGNTLFVDDDGRPHVDQWAYLASVRRLTPRRVREIAGLADRVGGAMGLGRTGGVRETASVKHSPDPAYADPSSDTSALRLVSKVIHATLASQLEIDVADLPPPLIDKLMRIAAFQNPEFHKRQAMRLSTALTPRVIHCAEHDGDRVRLPRGCRRAAEELIEAHGGALVVQDVRRGGRPIDLAFRGTLTDSQALAARALLAHDIGVFVAPPGSGKTVVGAYLAAARRRSTLVLVHRTQLLDQWRTQLGVFLDLPGRRVGQIGGGRNRQTHEFDVAMIQSLARGDEAAMRIAGYGHVIVDECHHVPAVSFERVMKHVDATFITGLTATPQRRDGHEPILAFQLGPTRFELPARLVDNGAFRRELIVRTTAFGQDEAETSAGIQDLYSALTTDARRNDRIFDDVVGELHKGRSPLLLTERREHLDYWAARLEPFARHVVVLHGGMRPRERREAIQSLTRLETEERLVIATGRFAGEGFDDARLDTLFLTLPVSWKGTLVQYAGRLHRTHQGKSVVRIYDYHDHHVPMLAKMFEKRLRGYRSMGYRPVEAEAPPMGADYVVEYDENVPGS